MRTLKYHRKEEKRRAIAKETLDIYAAIASRLGIYWIKKELEDIAFQHLNPEIYGHIESLVAKDKSERENYIETVRGMILTAMEQAKIPCSVMGRYKHAYSIHQKMVSQNLEFHEVYDIIAFRIIVDTKSQCYEALGIIHALWKPIDKKFKDYVGRPKPNMYQSIHTTVVGPYGERVEIQIRTWEMDHVAKSGIAAHWSYKEGKTTDENVSRQFEWIQTLLENQANISDPGEFLEAVRIDLFPDEVHVFTPNGEVRSLPRGATPVDFAYLIHSEVGHTCIGAKVNGRMVPLKHELQNSDVVEIITQKNHHPSKDWLGFVKSTKAKNRIRQWIKVQYKQESIEMGRGMLEREFRKYRLVMPTVLKTEEMARVLEEFSAKTLDDLAAQVGFGKVTPLQVVNRYLKHTGQDIQPLPDPSPDAGEEKKRKGDKTGIRVRGLDDILVRFGKCCQPVPGDPIIGFITRGRGVTVHRVTCPNALKQTPEREIEVDWGGDDSATYPVKVRILSHDRAGLLADLSTTISRHGVNILNVHSDVRDDKTVHTEITMAVKDADHLGRVLTAIANIKPIIRVDRMDG